ncbi:SIS domain-containing protein [Neobacillus sp. PS3-34]|uniref:SIS domain-containing protein n=1 Tax=Neobacillus sp. PS3-34 TaxID=3070678 RepID=UPI0027DF6E6A|nr:SIS domain-containing protein [Neobacillus sp. PS3-34]WML49082.1 SIS domain-containing protein [Neobacillus sp. PS3-34]
MSNLYTFDEIISQPTALEKTYKILNQFEVQADKEDLIYLFTGCGTSYYLAISASRYFQAVTGKVALAIPASEIFMFSNQVFAPGKKYKLIAISRSGTTSEIIQALKHIEGNEQVTTLAVTCNGDTDMVRLSNESISLDHINEKSVVMTQSFTNMLYALQLFSATISGDKEIWSELERIPALMEKVISEVDVLKQVAENEEFESFIFLGAGVYNGLAREATLKLKEMTQTQCESYSNLEFRHGPISIVNEKTAAIIFTMNDTKNLDGALIQDIRNFGGYTIAIGDIENEDFADKVVNIRSGLSDLNKTVLLMPVLQMLAYYRAIKLGLDPDNPKNLTQVVNVSLT